MRRRLALLAVIGACGSTEPPAKIAPARVRPAAIADASLAIDAAAIEAEPTDRLPAGVTPLAYDMRLEVDPASDKFAGRVSIRVRLDAPTRTIWLHAQDLAITEARVGGEAAKLLPKRAHDLQGIQLARDAAAGEVTIELAYSGRGNHDQEGLFRQRGRLYSQGEAAFARRFVPCFDEPGFKTPWRVTLVVPKGQVALANAPQASERSLPDGRREVVFDEIAALPTYLVAIAVGPFALVDGGRVGRSKIPLRIVVGKGAEKRTAYAIEMAPKIVDALERYFDQPLPIAKLDLVSVPELFGAMEHPGLITFSGEILLGDARDAEYRQRFIRVCAHELAHQWTGNLVTPAWWDDLWLSESFATFLGDKVAAELGGFDDEVLRLQIDREDALEADAEVRPSALHRAIAAGDDVDETFDAIAYEKGRAVLVMFERFVGAGVMRTAIRAYVAAHAKGSAKTADFAAALAGASSPAVGRALVSLVEHAGTPIVELDARCAATPPVVIAHARDGVTVPVCIRHAGGRTCALVGDRTEIAGGCPWFVGNDGGAGYYEVAWPAAARPALAGMTAAERFAFGDDIAGATRRGELTPSAAARVIAELEATKDPYAVLGALAIAHAADAAIDPADRDAWQRWLARRFATHLTVAAIFSPKQPIDHAMRDAVLPLVPARVLDAAVVKRARASLERQLRTRDRDPELVAFVAQLAATPSDTTLWPLIERTLKQTDGETASALLQAAPALGAAHAAAIVSWAGAERFGHETRISILLAVLREPATAVTAWAALRPELKKRLLGLEDAEAKHLIEGLGTTCLADVRDELPATSDGATARAAIDRCLARRAAAGKLQLPPD